MEHGPEPGGMRQVLLLDLQDDPEAIARYERHHAPGAVPAEVVRSIRAAGILAMEIHRSGNRLVMTIETAPEFDAAGKTAADRDDPAVRAWEALMDAFQQPLPWAAPDRKWTPAHRIFALDEQADR